MFELRDKLNRRYRYNNAIDVYHDSSIINCKSQALYLYRMRFIKENVPLMRRRKQEVYEKRRKEKRNEPNSLIGLFLFLIPVLFNFLDKIISGEPRASQHKTDQKVRLPVECRHVKSPFQIHYPGGSNSSDKYLTAVYAQAVDSYGEHNNINVIKLNNVGTFELQIKWEEAFYNKDIEE